MLERGTLASGHQALLATHFGLSRQRVNQLVRLERELMLNEPASAGEPGSSERLEFDEEEANR
jgi:hypothetical protein